MTEPTKTAGARPAGTEDPQSAANAVREMFNTISPRYDLLNHVLSMNVDRLWWRRTARRFRHILRRNESEVLDLCCGTGDMTFALYRQAKRSRAGITGADFAREMLRRAERKGKGKPIRWVEADALHLPFPEQTFDLVTSAFGFRNLADYDAGLREILRVLRPNGELGILDFGEPKGAVRKVYRFYFKQVLPRVGTMISGVRGPYAYLPASVEKFPDPSEMLQRMQAAGFRRLKYTPYTFGIAGLYWGKK
ncbi:MAG TPA: bifunctional demethylmenaquinone methyltransferase/2-methoxy-6-polyprenyl-1,4-benzoquinol methylase UbiE [Terriglobales bacterium]|nr:bifunctional demethylmenaquinone methyltransferase/2-methoxy-6-polyprenyl-1,4-benzoquinol methylase UbiE [Terriglobales bacterium]